MIWVCQLSTESHLQLTNIFNNRYRLGQRFREHGDVMGPPAPRARPVRDELLEVVQQRFEEQPVQSARQAAREIGNIYS